MHFSMTTATPNQLRQRCRNSIHGGKKWDSNPEFQRDLVWSKDQKRYLIDSMKKKLPFGMITVVDFDGNTYVIDGKQRTNTIVSFMCDEFPDGEGNLWSQWTETERARCGSTAIAVQEVELEEREGWTDIVELFQRINTQSKQLTTGQLLWSCMSEEPMQFMSKVFRDSIDENDPFADKIIELRTKWTSCFCKGDYGIKGGGKTRGDITFLAGLVIPLLTDNCNAITTSFPILYENGLKKKVTENMCQKFFEKMDKFLDIAREGADCGYFKKLPKGYPTYGEISCFLRLVNIVTSDNDNEYEPALKHKYSSYLVESHNAQKFFHKLHENEDLANEWKNRQRKNRTIINLTRDLKFMRDKTFDLHSDDEASNDSDSSESSSED